MMKFEEFKKYVIDNIMSYIPEEFQEGKVETTNVTKANDTELTGIMVKKPGTNISPTVYLEPAYESYLDNGDEELEVRRLADGITRGLRNIPSITPEEILDFDSIKDKICCRMVNTDFNKEFIADKPHTDIEDLSVLYSIVLNKDEDGIATVTITDPMMEKYGVSLAELHEIAVKNQESVMPSQIRTLKDILVEDMARDTGKTPEELEDMIPDVDPMYVLTNEGSVNGAACVLSAEAMDKVRETVGDGVYILPSSVHEVIILPMDKFDDPEKLADMVRSVNQSAVSPEIKLSDNVYTYDFDNHQLVLADSGQIENAAAVMSM